MGIRGAGLFERDDELGRLHELLEAAVAGRGGAVAVVGPSGIGKTSLLAAVRDMATELGVASLTARGGELERDFSYGIVRQLFEQPLRRLDADGLARALEGAAQLAAPVVGAGPAAGAAGDEAFAVVHGLYWLSANLSVDRPLALLVDDLHWADAASLGFLAYLQRRVAELAVLVVTASRPPADATNAKLLEQVTSEPDVAVAVLQPLSAAAVERLVGAHLGDGSDAALARACHQATAGNPFLCETLLTALTEHGTPAGARDAGRLVELASGAAAAAVVRRLGRLPAPAVQLARAVAILGTDVELRHAAAVAELDERRAAAAADQLCAQQILRAGPLLDFLHPLLRAAVRDRIPPAEQAHCHARAARLLSGEDPTAEAAAAHLLAAAPAGEAWAVDVMRSAARRAVAQGDPPAAVSYLRRALREPPGRDVLGAVLHELGAAELRAGEPAPAAEHLGEAHRRAAAGLERAAVARDLALALTTPGDFAGAVDLLERTVAEIDDVDPDLARLLAAELHQSAVMEGSLCRAASERLAGLDADAPGDTLGERALLAALATDGMLRSLPAAIVRARAQRAFERGLLADQNPYSSLWGNAAFPLIFVDGFAEAADVAAAAMADAGRRGSPVGAARAFAVRAMLQLRLGALADAEADARTAVGLGLEAGYAISMLPLGVLVEALVEAGELAAANEALLEAHLDGPLPRRFLHNWVLHARARLRLAEGRLDDAIADADELGRRGVEGWYPWNPAIFPYRSTWALALLRRGDRERARTFAAEEVEMARRVGAPRAIGLALRTLGLSEGGADGLALLAESVAALDGTGARLEQAGSLVELGAAMRRAGNRSAARDPLTAGLELAHCCGARPLADRARQELLATGARPRRIMRTGVDALTPSELRIARMAADGMTNREIAQALFVTLRTVQVHLTHTYEKLGISTRAELPPGLHGARA